MKNQKNLTIALTVLIAVVGLTIVYAALSQNLSITFGSSASSAVVQKGSTWDIGFDTETATVNGTKTGYSLATCGTASVTKEGVTISSATLYTPGDSCTWNVKVKNNGNLNAKLNSFTWTQPQGGTCDESSNNTYTCGNIKYSVLKGTAALAANEKLTGGASVDLTIKVEIPADKNLSGTDVSQYNGKVQLNWVQD